MMSVYTWPLFCICLSPILIILTWPVIWSFAFANYILIYLSYFIAAARGGATTTGIKCSYPFFPSIRISPDFSMLSKLNTAEKSIPHFIRDPCLYPQYWVFCCIMNRPCYILTWLFVLTAFNVRGSNLRNLLSLGSLCSKGAVLFKPINVGTDTTSDWEWIHGGNWRQRF